MEKVFGFLHVLGAVGMGFYLLLPFLTRRLSGLSAQAQEGYVGGLYTANRIGQFLLIVQFLTGGYMISKADYSVAWMVIIIVLFVALGALSGIMGKPMKQLMASVKAGKKSVDEVRKVQTFSVIVAIVFLAVIVFMAFPIYK